MKFLKNIFKKKSIPPPPPNNIETDHTPTNQKEIANVLEDELGIDAAINHLEDKAFAIGAPPSIGCALVRLYLKKGEEDQALEILAILLDRHQDDVETLNLVGETHNLLKSLKVAEQYHRKALQLAPNDVYTICCLAMVLKQQGRYEETAELLDKAYAVNPCNSTVALNLASALCNCGRYTEALEYADKAIHLNPQLQAASLTLKYACRMYLGQMNEAEKLLSEAITRTPNDPNLRFGRSLINLLNHNFSEGWAEYRFRLQTDPGLLRLLPFPEWKGEPLEGKTLLITIEQGLGDQVMFASCLPDVLRQNPKKVYIEVHQRLAPIFSRSFPAVHVIPSQQNHNFDWLKQINDIDTYIQLGDLPALFRHQLALFPAHNGYIKAAPDKVSYWKDRLSQQAGRLKIGISWKGGTEKTRSHIRSLTPATLLPFFQLPDIAWVSLQYKATHEDLAKLPAHGPASSFMHMANTGEDIEDLAALISSLDLIITVCNTNVHLAGALGKEAWVLTPAIPEWRYGMTDRMPWYPTVTLIRQPDHGDWEAVIKQAASKL